MVAGVATQLRFVCSTTSGHTMSSGIRRSARVSGNIIPQLQNTAHTGRDIINRLPDEILREIFMQYNRMGNGSTMTLLRVCRVWQTVVICTLALWNRICFAPLAIIRELRRLCIDRFLTYIACTTSQQVAKAIRRLHNTKFELVCCLVPDLCSTEVSYWEGLKPVWFEQQCRALSLLVEGPLERFPHMFHKMVALEEFVVSEMGRSFLRFFDELEEFSTNLYTLELQGGFPPEIARYATLLGRLKSLSLESSSTSSGCLSDIVAAAKSLRTLNWVESTRRDFSIPLIPSSTTLNHILLTNAGVSVFSGPRAYELVVELEIKFTNKRSWVFHEDYVEITMPALKTLVLEGRWAALRSIRAPNVRVLLLRRSNELMKERVANLRNTTLRPEVLRIDRCIAESELASALKATWNDIEELHVMLSSRNDHIRTHLARSLSGVRGHEALCPKLRAITVLLLKPEASRSGILGTMNRAMREIGIARRNLGNLELLRCGWVQWAGKLQEGGMESWPNQEWLDFV